MKLLGVNGKAGDFGGIAFVYIDPITNRRVTARVRRDHPPLKVAGTPDKKVHGAVR